MKLSVVIISYNVREYLRKAVLSSVAAIKDIDGGIIVVDNNSSDGTCMMIHSEFSNVKLIALPVNEGFAAACNHGIKATDSEYVLILNPDTDVSPDAFSTALSFMEQHPEAGAAGAHMRDGDGRFLPESKRGFPSLSASFFKFTGLCRIFAHSPFFNAYYLGHLPEDKICRADILTGAFMFIRREALKKCGCFDTTFFMYGEDIDLSWRIRKAGYINYYIPQTRIIHYKGKSAGRHDPVRIRHFYNAMIIFVRKHISPVWQLPAVFGIKTVLTFSLFSAFLLRLLNKREVKKLPDEEIV